LADHKKYAAANGIMNHPSYRESAPKLAATPAAATHSQPCVCRKRTVKYRRAIRQAAKIGSVIAVDCR
jgi:hypothetical protein